MSCKSLNYVYFSKSVQQVRKMCKQSKFIEELLKMKVNGSLLVKKYLYLANVIAVAKSKNESK